MLFMLSTANIPDVLKSSRMTGVTYTNGSRRASTNTSGAGNSSFAVNIVNAGILKSLGTGNPR